ncbi:MAG: hypothetical protein N4A53_13680 [Pelagimonas sp.]|jgi:hypothetical protein|nr:hypothetical protein [Pelagimonas sp.]
MRDFTEEEQAELVATAKRQVDFDDQQREAAGVDVGRYARFYPVGDSRHPDAKRKKDREEQLRRTLEELMRDPEYARLYTELGDRLRDAETEADATIVLIEARLAEAARHIEDIEDSAARGPDGRLVFRYADGRVVYADGSEVEDEIAEGIIWPDNAPSAEAYFAARDRQRGLEALRNDWHTYRYDVIGDIRNRYETDDPPMSKGDLEDALDDIERLVPDASALEIARNPNAIPTPQVISLHSIPTGLST